VKTIIRAITWSSNITESEGEDMLIKIMNRALQEKAQRKRVSLRIEIF